VHKILLNSVLLSHIVSGGVRPKLPGQTPLGHNPPLILPLEGRLGSGPHLEGQIGSGVRVLVSVFDKNTRRVLYYDVLRQKIAVFTYRSPHFCFPWRRPCDYHAIYCTDGKTIQCLPNPSQHVLIYFQQFPSYSNRKCQKSPFSRTAAHIFCFPWRRPCDYHAICCMDGKTIQCLPNPSQHVPIYLQ